MLKTVIGRVLVFCIAALVIGCGTPRNLPEKFTRADVVFIRGMAGSIYSAGLDEVAEKLRETHPSLRVRVVSHGTENIAQWRPRLIVGHSLGANKGVTVTQQMEDLYPHHRVTIIALDPVSFSSKVRATHIVPANVRKAQAFLSTDGRARKLWPENKRTVVRNRYVEMGHVELDNAPSIQRHILREVRRLF